MGNVVGLTYDLKEDYVLKEGDPQDLYAEFDPAVTVNIIIDALKKRGHTVKKIGNAQNLLHTIDKLKVDIVFNISEGLTGRNRESQVPIILEMYNIPFVGSDGLTLALTLDKIMAKKIFLAENIPTPRFAELKDAGSLNGQVGHLDFPMIVKTRHEGSSKGLTEKSRVENEKRLKEQIGFVTERYHQPALVEEFIQGSEFTVGIIGNEDPLVFPAVQVEIDGKVDLGDMFYTFARITSDRLKYICPARIPKKLEKKMRAIALQAYKAVECRDFGRVDFRVDAKGNPYVLEINPLPCLSIDDTFNTVTKEIGMSYEEVVDAILHAALQRYGLSSKKRRA
ncbi:ATP-grasp domain-containing protein [Candidatus Omnitrophota bacterium]